MTAAAQGKGTRWFGFPKWAIVTYACVVLLISVCLGGWITVNAVNAVTRPTIATLRVADPAHSAFYDYAAALNPTPVIAPVGGLPYVYAPGNPRESSMIQGRPGMRSFNKALAALRGQELYYAIAAEAQRRCGPGFSIAPVASVERRFTDRWTVTCASGKSIEISDNWNYGMGPTH